MKSDTASTEPIVYVVDDDPSIRKAMTRLFKSHGLQVATFANADEFLDCELQDSPGCLILDVDMPGLSGIELQQRLTSNHVDLPIVFMSGHGDIPMTVKAMQAGAVDFLPKPVSNEKLMNTVQQAVDRHWSQRKESAAQHDFRQRVDTLSKREYEVMTLVITGMLNKQIAGRLGITEHTVKVHRGRVMEKAGVVSVAELVRLCERSGIAMPDE